MDEAGTSAIQVDRDSANADVASQYCAAIIYTHNTVSVLGQLFARTEDSPSLVHQLRGKQVSLSMRVKTATASAVRIRIQDTDGTNLTQTDSSFHTGGGTYETLYVTHTLQTDATAIAVYVRLEATATIYADNAMLVVGSVPTAYVPMHPADDLARCQRYFEVTGGAAGARLSVGQAITTTAFQTVLNYLVDKAVAPTVAIGPAAAATDFRVTNAAGAAVACTAITTSVVGTRTCLVSGDVASGLVAGNALRLEATNSSGVIYIEANP
jgi:hypothetical protein